MPTKRPTIAGLSLLGVALAPPTASKRLASGNAHLPIIDSTGNAAVTYGHQWFSLME